MPDATKRDSISGIDDTSPGGRCDAGATFYTVSNDRFFPGTVALLNSLRLTGNRGELVVLDCGLTGAQRTRLDPHVTIVEVSADRSTPPPLLKPWVHLLEPQGTLVWLDSDMIVTGSLDYVVELAKSGSICVYPDHQAARQRWFPEWEDLFALTSPPRQQTYVNSGLVAFSQHHWGHLLERWWQACRRVPWERVFAGEYEQPFFTGDQDALNALLMSEFPRDAVAVLPPEEAPLHDALDEVEVVNQQNLICTYAGRPTKLLHYSWSPKAWERRAWPRIRHDAYVQLVGRVLFNSDLTTRLDPRGFPVWLRPGIGGYVSLRALTTMHHAARTALYGMPAPVRTRLLSLYNGMLTRP
jgi:hypothetical protein